jgi:hypothetical protein
MANELSMNFENRAWKSSNPQKANANTTTFNCSIKDKTASVSVWGTTARNITWITVNAKTKISYGWPRFIAALPIDGVDPDSAQKWVTTALNAKASSNKVFGDIKFNVVAGIGIPHTLTIAHKNTKHR